MRIDSATSSQPEIAATTARPLDEHDDERGRYGRKRDEERDPERGRLEQREVDPVLVHDRRSPERRRKQA